MSKIFSIIVIAVMCVCGTAKVSLASDGRAVVKAVNKIRAAHGLSRLRLEPRLQRAARNQSSLMARSRKMAHTVRRGHDLGSRLKRVGYRGLAAENIARGSFNLNRILKGLDEFAGPSSKHVESTDALFRPVSRKGRWP